MRSPLFGPPRVAVSRWRRDRPLLGPCVHSACLDDLVYCSHPPPRFTAWRLPLRRGGRRRHVRLFAVRAVSSPQCGPRLWRHAFSSNRHAWPRGVLLAASYATWRTVLYGVAYLSPRAASTRHAGFGRGGQCRHVAGRGASWLFGTPRVAYVVLFGLPDPPRGFSVLDAWRTAFSTHPPRRRAWRLRTPRVAYPLLLVRHAFAPASPCVLSHRASGRRTARSSAARSGRLPCPGERLHHSSSRVAGWQKSAAGVVLPGGSFLLLCLAQPFVRPLAVEAPVAPLALAADAGVGSRLVRGRAGVWLGFARSASGQ